MRSRPDLDVRIWPAVARPGQGLEVEARFLSRSDTPLDAVIFRLTGRERVVVGAGRNQMTWSHEHVALEARHPAGVLTPGTHRYGARFEIPPHAPPSWKGFHTTIAYELAVRADIPWWPDRAGRYEVCVVGAAVEPPATGGHVFVSTFGGPRGSELYAEVALDRVGVEPGGALHGTVSLANVGGLRARRVVLALVGRECVRAEGGFLLGTVNREREVFRFVSTLCEAAPGEGQSLPFRMAVPPQVPPSFVTALTTLRWSLEVAVETTWRTHTPLAVPLTVLPPGGNGSRVGSGSGRPPAPDGLDAGVPAVGRERRAQVWSYAGRRMGFDYDPEADLLRGRWGVVAVRVGVEPRGEGLHTVARLAWPHLGMDLEVGPGQWTDRLARDEINLGDGAFDARFRVRGRLAEQVRALLPAPVREVLLALSESSGQAVHLDDDGATLAAPGMGTEAAALEPFIAAVARVAVLLDASHGAVPAPPALRPGIGAWRAFAERLGGWLETGRGWIHDATLAAERFELGTCWSRGGEFESTWVALRLDPALPGELDPAGQDARWTPVARGLVEALTKRASHVQIGPDVLGVQLDAMATDPASLEPLMDVMARLGRALQGRDAAAPFR